MSNDPVKCWTQKCITCRQYVQSKEFHVKKDWLWALTRTCWTPVSMFSCIYVMPFLNFWVSRRNIGTLEFNEVWSDRLVTSKNSLKYPVALVTSPFTWSSILHNAHHRRKLTFGPSKAQLNISFKPKIFLLAQLLLQSSYLPNKLLRKTYSFSLEVLLPN